jgi:exopolysaccharide biosynthesis polyprenyl glycosylphosphotransferase
MPGTSYSFSKETSVLWAGETLVCFVLFYAVLYKALNQLNLAAVDHAAVYALTFGATALAVGIYRTEVRREWRQLLSRTVVAAILSLPIIWCILYLIPITPFRMPPAAAATEFMVWTLLVVAVRILFGFASQAQLFGQQVVVLGASPATTLIRSAIGLRDRGSLLSSMQDLPGSTWSHGVWALVVDQEAARSLAPNIRAECRQRGIKVVPDSEFLETTLHRLDLDTLRSGGFAACTAPRGLATLATRLFDIAFAVAMLIAVMPVMSMVALAIKLQDGGPIFYLQDRVGFHGQTFTLFKFRSMRADAEAQGPVWAQQSDRRVTRIGAVIRRLRFDELPQLLNILRGEMSVIGPRPERPHFVAQLEEAIPCYSERALVKPGLTGWAQVNYPYGASIEDARAKLSYDLYYVKHRTMWLDLRILFATVRVVLFAEGAR